MGRYLQTQTKKRTVRIKNWQRFLKERNPNVEKVASFLFIITIYLTLEEKFMGMTLFIYFSYFPIRNIIAM